MNPNQSALSLWPASASAAAVSVDWLIVCFTIVTIMLTAPVFISITYFAFKYRYDRIVDRSHGSEGRDSLIEMTWMIIPFCLTLIFFAWAARLYIQQQDVPAGAITIDAIGRQWMWKFQHPGGQAEINDLHVPVGQNIRINMISQDVIHALYIPALRIQMDALPDRYTHLWFKADRTGEYHLFCSEFCGTDHSVMAGILTIMSPTDYQVWLSQAHNNQSLVAGGARIYEAQGCGGCHNAGSAARAPSLGGLYGQTVQLADGGTATADETFLRNVILNPAYHMIAGYPQIMPSYRGEIPEDELTQLIAYLKSLPPASSEPPR
jgi:cytochrome c oxidase subunit 2